MRASRSSIQCRIFVFHSVGTILRTGTLGRLQRSSTRRGTDETSCANVAANPRRFGAAGDSTSIYPSGDHKPMVLLLFRSAGVMLSGALVAPSNHATCTYAVAAPRTTFMQRSFEKRQDS